MKNIPKVSVIVPVFNEGQYLRQCLESIVSQNYDNLEVCISDNGSTDNTVEIIKEFESNYSFLKCNFNSTNIGGYNNLRLALELSTGDFIYLIGGDDYVKQDLFSDAIQELKENKYSAILIKMNYFEDNSDLIVATLPLIEFEKIINQSCSLVSDFFLKYINHDEIILGIFNREDFLSSFRTMNRFSLEPIGLWLFISYMLKQQTKSIKILEKVYLMKRVEKSEEFDFSYNSSEMVDFSSLKLRFLKIRGSIYNSFYLLMTKTLGFKDFLKLLIYPRFHSEFGISFGGPFAYVFLQPFLKINNLIKFPKKSR